MTVSSLMCRFLHYYTLLACTMHVSVIMYCSMLSSSISPSLSLCLFLSLSSSLVQCLMSISLVIILKSIPSNLHTLHPHTLHHHTLHHHILHLHILHLPHATVINWSYLLTTPPCNGRHQNFKALQLLLAMPPQATPPLRHLYVVTNMQLSLIPAMVTTPPPMILVLTTPLLTTPLQKVLPMRLSRCHHLKQRIIEL